MSKYISERIECAKSGTDSDDLPGTQRAEVRD